MSLAPEGVEPAIIDRVESPRTKTIHADELRAGYEVVLPSGRCRTVERVRRLVRDHIVIVTWEPPDRYVIWSRDHKVDVVLSEVDF